MVNSSIPLQLLLWLLEFTRKTNISVLSKRKVFCIEKSSTSISSPNPNLLHTCSPGLPFLVITHTRHSLFLPSKLDSLPWLLPYWNKSQSFEEIGICKWLFFFLTILFLLRLSLMLCMWSCLSLVLLHWFQSFCGLDSLLFFYIEFNHSVPLLTISEQTHIKKNSSFIHICIKKTQSLFIFSYVYVLICAKGTNLEVGFVSYCWLWSLDLCSSKSRKLWRLQNFWMSCY